MAQPVPAGPPQGLEPWVATQEKTFRNWANFYLKARDLKMTNLVVDMRDGVMLFNLVEILTGQPLGKCHPAPKLPVLKLENLNKALQAVGGVKGVAAEDIMNGNLKLILGCMWRLIQKFQIRAGEDDGDEGDSHSSGRNTILDWIKNYVPEACEGVDIYKDCPRVFSDGKILNHIVNKTEPGSVDLSELDNNDNYENVSNALNAAEKIGVPKLIDAEDLVCDKPDEQSVLTYLSALKTTIEQRERGKEKDKKMQGFKGKTNDLRERLRQTDQKKQQKLAELKQKRSQESDDVLDDVQPAGFEVKEATEVHAEFPCEICNLPLSGKIVEVENLDGSLYVYHLNCFVCHTCKQPFTEHFWRVKGKPYCREHHRIAQGFICAKCTQAILEIPVEALKQFYHKQCFLCSACNGSLSGGFFDLNNHPACSACYKAKKPAKFNCYKCKQPIYGAVLDALDKKWHDPECFVCTKCGKRLEGDFVDVAGMPYCEGCD